MMAVRKDSVDHQVRKLKGCIQERGGDYEAKPTEVSRVISGVKRFSPAIVGYAFVTVCLIQTFFGGGAVVNIACCQRCKRPTLKSGYGWVNVIKMGAPRQLLENITGSNEQGLSYTHGQGEISSQNRL